MKKNWINTYILISILFLALPSANAYNAVINIDTSDYNGISAIINFDFIDGGTPSNQIKISDFSTDGVLSSSSSEGDVVGDLSALLELGDEDFFNEFSQKLVLGDTLSFSLDLTENFPNISSSPDEFSLFLLDVDELSLFPTQDPTGADALFTADINGSDNISLEPYHSSVDYTVTSSGEKVPLLGPYSLTLLFAGLGALGIKLQIK